MNDMDTTAYKVDEETIGIIKEVPPQKEDHQYKVDFLLEQLEAIQAQKVDYIAARNVEQAEIRKILSHAYILDTEINLQPEKI
jgi:hypothetical protein